MDIDIIEKSLTKILFKLNNNSNIPIVKSIAYCLSLICKYHFDIINDNPNKFNQFIREIIQILEIHINHQNV